LEVSRPPPGQPDRRYRLDLDISKSSRSAHPTFGTERRSVASGSRRWSSGWSPGPPIGAEPVLIPAAVRFPVGHGRSYGLVGRDVKPAGQRPVPWSTHWIGAGQRDRAGRWWPQTG